MTLSGYLTSKSVFGQHCCSIDASLEPTAKIWMKIDPYYQRQKCRPMNLFSGNIRFMRIFTGVRLGRGVDFRETILGVVDDGNFWGLRWLRLRKLQRYGKQYYFIWRYATPCQPVTDCKMNDLVKIRCRPALLESERWMSKNNTTCAILRCSVHCTIS